MLTVFSTACLLAALCVSLLLLEIMRQINDALRGIYKQYYLEIKNSDLFNYAR